MIPLSQHCGIAAFVAAILINFTRIKGERKIMKFLVETSARHVHLTQEHLEILFGAGYELTKKKDLSQPGQFRCV